jgi:hypothetical protein
MSPPGGRCVIPLRRCASHQPVVLAIDLFISRSLLHKIYNCRMLQQAGASHKCRDWLPGRQCAVSVGCVRVLAPHHSLDAAMVRNRIHRIGSYLWAPYFIRSSACPFASLVLIGPFAGVAMQLCVPIGGRGVCLYRQPILPAHQHATGMCRRWAMLALSNMWRLG